MKNFLLEDDIKDAEIIMASTLFFKGKWTYPFKKVNTTRRTFYNDDNKPIGNVEMMAQEGPFPYVVMKEIRAHMVELPYGKVCTILLYKFAIFTYLHLFT